MSSHVRSARAVARTALVALSGAAALSLAVAGCSSIERSLGAGKTPPDEFAVVRSAPLTLPPDYSLRPPSPGAPRPNQPSIRDQAASTVFEDSAGAANDRPETSGEVALLNQAGAIDADPTIRQKVNREFSIYVEEQDSFFEGMMFWRQDEPLGRVVDAEGEAQRLRENAALGDPATKGETPTIQRREKALLEGIF